MLWHALACALCFGLGCQACRCVAGCRFTGADISALVREAAFKALDADIDAACVSQSNLLKALQHVKPSAPVTPAQACMYATFKQGSH